MSENSIFFRFSYIFSPFWSTGCPKKNFKIEFVNQPAPFALSIRFAQSGSHCVLTSSSNGQGRGAPESWTGCESAEAGWLTNSILKFFLGHPVYVYVKRNSKQRL